MRFEEFINTVTFCNDDTNIWCDINGLILANVEYRKYYDIQEQYPFQLSYICENTEFICDEKEELLFALYDDYLKRWV